MILAIPYEKGTVFQHFGKTEAFKLYDIREGVISGSKVVGTDGNGHGALSAMLSEWKVSTLICGGIGGGAQSALAEYGIQVFGGVSGEADKAAEAYLSGTLDYQPEVMCNHHHHAEGENCGQHGDTCSH